MHISEQDILEIYQKSLALKKLSLGHFTSLDLDSIEIHPEKRDKWCQIISQGDQRNFEKRFLWSRTNEQSSPFVNDDAIEVEEEIRIPAWATTLNECLKATVNPGAQPDNLRNNQLLNPDFPQPFQEILVPFIYYAREQLKFEAGEDYNLVAECAHIELEKSLFDWLSYLNSLPMELEFSTFRAFRQSSLKRVFKSKREEVSNVYYEKFIKHLLNGNLCNYFKEYTVLARLMATAVEQWIETVAELISRFKKNKLLLQKTFNEAKELGKIINAKTSLSDRHNKGRTVMILEFESGVKVVYKPKNSGIEQAYNKLIELLNSTGAPVEFKTFKVLDYEDYGWIEFVTGKPLETITEAQNYYKRAGGLLCVVYLLGATDLHYENIIGNGDFPVLIDIETLLHPFVHESTISDKNENAHTKAKKLLIHSVMRTGLLPHWHLEEEGQAYDVSGLGKFMPQEFSIDGVKWKNINTDLMQVRKEKISIYSNGKSSDAKINEDLSLDNFAAEIIQGFSQLYNFLIQKRDVIINSSCWHALASQSLRFVFRPTKIYSQIQQNLLYPEVLKSGIDRSIHLDILYKGSTVSDSPPSWWPLIQAEQDAMEIMDIPHFSAKSDSDTIELPGGKNIENYFTEPSFYTATKRLKELNEQDLKQQVDFIKGALLCRSADGNHTLAKKEIKEINKKYASLTKYTALRQAISIAGILKQKAIVAKDGSITWISPKYHPNVKRYQLEPISTDLYDGSTGIAIFFAALYSLTGQEEYKDFSLGALKIPSTQIEEAEAPLTIGGFAGDGSLVYGFLKVGILTEDLKLIDVAQKAASLLTKSSIDQDKTYDIMYGSAGTILSLLQLYEYSKDDSILELLIYSGDHLLKNRSVSTSGFSVWESNDKTFLTGLSHGAAGIAYALLRLYELTNNTGYKEAALKAIAYESSVFDKTENNWPDYRKSETGEEIIKDESKFMCAWCHGAAGIGLARLATLDILDTKDIRNDIRISIETTKRYLASGTDHLCCGNFGRLELLLAASLKFSDQELLKFTLDKAGAIIQCAEKNGDFQYNPQIGFTPGFFQGISGIGYQILRLAYPEVLPSALILD